MHSDRAVTTTDIMDAFRSWLADQGLADGTVRAYCGDARAVLGALSENGEQASVEGLDANAALRRIYADCEAGRLTAATGRRRSTALRKLLQFLNQSGHCCKPQVPALRITNQLALQTPIDMSEIGAVIDAPDTSTASGKRDRALLEVLLDTGMQLRELCALCVDDWDEHEHQLTVGQGKRRRQVRVLVGGIYVGAHVHALGDATPSSPLFPSRSGGFLTPRDIGRVTDKYAVQAGLEAGDVTPQMIIAAGRMHMINLWPERAKGELGYSQLSAARRRYAHPELAAQGQAEREKETTAITDEELSKLVQKTAREIGIGRRPSPSAGDQRWLARALKYKAPSPRHGFPPVPPSAVFSRYRSLLREADLNHRMHLTAIGYALRPFVQALDRRARNRRGHVRLADPASLVSLRAALLVSDQLLAIPAWLSDGHLEQSLQSPDILFLSERLMRPDASAEAAMEKVERKLERVERARRARTDAVVSGRPPDELHQPEPFTPDLVDNQLRGPYYAVQFLTHMLSEGRGWGPFAWLADQLWPFMRRAYACAVEYYRVREAEAWNDASVGAVFVSMVTALIRTSPRALHDAGLGVPLKHIILPYFECAFVECLATNLAVAHDLPPLWNRIEDAGPSRWFLRAFESEWEKVLPYTDGRFGFLVVPRLSAVAFQMYLETVSWSTQGWRGAIRREVLDYFAHRGLWLGEAISVQLAGRWEERTWSLLAPLMEPLVQAQARRLCRSDRDLQEDAVASELRQELRGLIDRYDPHRRFQHEPDRVARGAIGAGRREDVARAAASLGATGKDRPLPLLLYLERELKRHVGLRLREGLELGSIETNPTIVGPDGDDYETTYGAARRLECSDHQVRRLDDVLAPRRLCDFWPAGVPDRYRHLPRNTRLYHVGNTPWAAGRTRLQAWARRSGEVPPGYKTRAAVARGLGVHSTALMRWEERGYVCPRKWGRYVLYSREDAGVVKKLESMRMRIHSRSYLD